MFCICGKEFTTTSASPWISCTIIDGKIVSGKCQHGTNFPPIGVGYIINPFATYEEYVDQ